MEIVQNAPTQTERWSIFGHRWAVDLLQRTLFGQIEALVDADLSVGGGAASVANDMPRGPRHAYLLTGPRHVGKTTLAMAFARALLCTAPPHEAPCGHCRSCRLVEHGNHPDIRFIQPVDKDGQVDRNNGLLRADQASELVREVAMRPLEGDYKVYILQDMHTANDSFSNKVLKTLEEPPPHVVLCLTADDRSNLLATIVSRCQVLALRPLDRQTVQAALLSRWQMDEAQADLLSRLAGGRLGWAVQEATSQSFLTERGASLDRLFHLITASRIERLVFAEALTGRRGEENIFHLLELWTVWWRDVMLVQTGCVDACTNVDRLGELTQMAERIQPAAVRSYLELLRRIDGYLHHTVNTRLALDVLLLKMPRPQSK